MKLSLDWLSEFVDLSGLSAETVAEQLSVKTAEVDELETVERWIDDVRVVQILECRPVAGGLQEVLVDLGGRTARTFSAAPNLAAGRRAVFAAAGTALKGGPAKVPTHAGVAGEGVLCTAGELGLGAANELLELPAEVPLGALLADHCARQDQLITIDNKSLTHRPDLWGHYGFARELAAIFERPLRPYEVADTAPFGELPAVPIEIENYTDCPVYTGFIFALAVNPPSPLLIQRRLSALGISSKNLLVDLSNYVQFELGQPTHAFDADTVENGIRIARALPGQKIRTLGGNEWSMSSEDLLIYSGEKPVALAGIMGGAETQIREGTCRVLLESANFSGTRVRRTSARLGLRTEASLRFEKKLPPVLTRIAGQRFYLLTEKYGAAPQPSHSHTINGDLRDRFRPLTIAPGYLSRAAGTAIANEKAAQILRSIGFGCEIRESGELDVQIPSFRSETDISIVQDISEEVIRLFGYDHIPPQLPIAELKPAQIETRLHGHHRQRRCLTQVHGFVEVQSYGWLSDEWAERIGHRPERPMTLRNPPAEGRGRMRDTLLANLLEFAYANRKVREDFRMFELGKVFSFNAENRSREENQLAGLSVCQSGAAEIPAHLREIRAAIDDLTQVAALLPLDYQIEAKGSQAWEVDGYLLTIRLGGQVVGRLGVLPPTLVKLVLNRGHAIWFWLRPDLLNGTPFPVVPYQPLPAFPGSWQDFTLVWDRRRGYGELVDKLRRFHHPLIDRTEFRGVFESPDQETANYTFRFHLRAADRTLGSEDLVDFRTAMTGFLASTSLTLL